MQNYKPPGLLYIQTGSFGIDAASAMDNLRRDRGFCPLDQSNATQIQRLASGK